MHRYSNVQKSLHPSKKSLKRTYSLVSIDVDGNQTVTKELCHLKRERVRERERETGVEHIIHSSNTEYLLPIIIVQCSSIMTISVNILKKSTVHYTHLSPFCIHRLNYIHIIRWSVDINSSHVSVIIKTWYSSHDIYTYMYTNTHINVKRTSPSGVN